MPLDLSNLRKVLRFLAAWQDVSSVCGVDSFLSMWVNQAKTGALKLESSPGKYFW